MPEPNISSFTGLLSDKDRDVADIASNVDAVSLAKDLVRSLRRARWNKADWALSGSTENPHDNYLMRTGLMDLSSGTTRAASADANYYNRIMERLNNIPVKSVPWNEKLVGPPKRQAPFTKKYDSGTLMLNYPVQSDTVTPLVTPWMPRLNPDSSTWQDDYITYDWVSKRTLGI